MKILLQLLAALLVFPATAAPPPPAARADSLTHVLQRYPQPDTVRARRLLLAAVAWQRPDPAQALTYATQAAALYQRLGQPTGRLTALVLESRLLCGRNQLDRADSVAGLGMRLARAAGDSLHAGQLFNNLAIAQGIRGNYDRAAALFVRALQLYEYVGQPPARLAAVRDNIGQVLLHIKRYEAASQIFRQNLALDSTVRSPYERIGNLGGLGIAARYLHRYAEADRYFAQTLALARRYQMPDAEAETLANLGFMRSQQGRWTEAEAELGRAVQMARTAGEPQDLAVRLIGWGETLNALRRPAEAVAAAREALALAQKIGAREEIRDAYELLASGYAGQGRPAEAYAALDLHHQWRDSLLTEETARQVTEIQTKYDTERQAARNQLQAAKLLAQEQVIRRRNVQLVAGLLGVALLAGLAYLLYTRRRLRREVEFAQERQRLEHQRAAAVLAAEEAERHRIGADLHDGIGQLLSVVKINVNGLCEELRPQLDPDQEQRFGDALDLVDESVREVRGISHNLLPNALIKRGLARAVREFLDKLQRPGRLKIRLETLGLDMPKLDPTVESTLYRVIQELVQNIIKHANATEMEMQIIRHDHDLTLLVEDNGVGFDPKTLRAEAGIGLQSVTSRVAYLGGTLEVDSRVGRGTTVTVQVPV